MGISIPRSAGRAGVLVGQRPQIGRIGADPAEDLANNMAVTIGLTSEKAWKRGSPGATSYTAERLFGPKILWR